MLCTPYHQFIMPAKMVMQQLKMSHKPQKLLGQSTVITKPWKCGKYTEIESAR
jgi:hypothetical protein